MCTSAQEGVVGLMEMVDGSEEMGDQTWQEQETRKLPGSGGSSGEVEAP